MYNYGSSPKKCEIFFISRSSFFVAFPPTNPSWISHLLSGHTTLISFLVLLHCLDYVFGFGLHFHAVPAGRRTSHVLIGFFLLFWKKNYWSGLRAIVMSSGEGKDIWRLPLERHISLPPPIFVPYFLGESSMKAKKSFWQGNKRVVYRDKRDRKSGIKIEKKGHERILLSEHVLWLSPRETFPVQFYNIKSTRMHFLCGKSH